MIKKFIVLAALIFGLHGMVHSQRLTNNPAWQGVSDITNQGNLIDNDLDSYGSQVSANVSYTSSVSTDRTFVANFSCILPGKASTISGISSVCKGATNISYSIPIIEDATSYLWTYSGTGATINGNANTIPIDYALNSTNRDLTVIGINNCVGGNPISMEILLFENVPITIYNVNGGGTFCLGWQKINIGLDGSQTGIFYNLYQDGTYTGNMLVGTGEPLNFNVWGGEGVYTVWAENDSESLQMEGSAYITNLPLPAKYNLIGGGVYCEGGHGVEIGLDGSELGVLYELVCNNTMTGISVLGTGGPVVFGNNFSEGIYWALVSVWECLVSWDMNGSVEVEMLDGPILFAISNAGSYMQIEPGIPIELNGSTQGVTYEIYRNNIPTGITISGTGDPLVFINQTTVGVYTIKASVNSTGCSSFMEGSIIIEKPSPYYSITTASSPSDGGSATDGGTYASGQPCTVTASANSGYTFSNWTENGSQVSTNSSYSFDVSGDRFLVANFTLQQFSIITLANPAYGGTTFGGGMYNYGDQATLTATPAIGWNFVNWTNSLGNIVSEEMSFDYVMSAENVTFQANFISCNHGWIPISNLQFNMQILAQIMIDDAVSANTNDILGAFVGDECRGIASPLEDLGMTFLTVGSNQASGELIELKIWNSTLCEFCEAGPGFTFVNLGEIGTIDNPLQVSCITDVDLNFNFGQGYNWFSENLALENLHPNAFLEGLEACNNDRLISQSSFSVYQNGSWNGTITALNSVNSYRLKLCEDKAFTVTAPPAEILSIALNSGYTWMGYMPQACLPINMALANMNPAPVANDRLIGQVSFALYSGSQWVGSLTTLCPGAGYVIKLANSATLIYPEASAKAKMSNSLEAELRSPTDINPAKNLQHSMTVLGQLELPSGQYSNNAYDRVYAYVNGQCVGMANPMGAENGLIFLSVGENSDEAQQISFKIWLDAEKQLYEANETLTFVPLKATGAYENPFKFTLGQPVNSENDWFIGEPYPNPFNEETLVPVYLNEPSTLVLKLYNTMGQIVYTTEKSFNTAGKHEFLLKKEQLNADVYSLSIKILNQKQFLNKSKTLIIN